MLGTLGAIAKEAGTAIPKLMAANPGINDPNKMKAFEWAAGMLGDKSYAVAGAIDRFKSGQNKCNLFCSHACEKGSGMAFPRHAFLRFSGQSPASAAELAQGEVGGTRLVDVSRARIGDVIAWRMTTPMPRNIPQSTRVTST
jgi:hypothetical protein